jgi:hypothetical protein
MANAKEVQARVKIKKNEEIGYSDNNNRVFIETIPYLMAMITPFT